MERVITIKKLTAPWKRSDTLQTFLIYEYHMLVRVQDFGVHDNAWLRHFSGPRTRRRVVSIDNGPVSVPGY